MPTPRRSLWGWGTEDAAVGLDETQARIEPFFGASEREAVQPPRVPRARVDVPAKLAGFSLADDATRAAHAMGKAYPDRVRGFRGDFSSAPDVVCFPSSEHELSVALEVAEHERLSVTPFGGGSSVVGGVEPQLGPTHRGAMTIGAGELEDGLGIGLETQPGHAVKNHLHGFRRRALAIGIFDPQQKLSTRMTCIKPVEKRSASSANVHGPGGGGGDTGDDGAV